MGNDRIWQAVWLRDPAFAGTVARDPFHKQHQPAPAHPEHPAELLNRRMLLRRRFHLDALPAAPLLYVTADDAYRLYLNGTLLAEGPAPSFAFRYRYDVIDLSKHLKPGENVIAMQVFYQGLINRVWVSGDLRQGAIAELCDGEQVLVKTDATWKQLCFAGNASARYGYDTQFVEHPDARHLPPPDWMQIAFDDTNWQAAREHPQDDHTLVQSEIPPLCPTRVEPTHVCALPGGVRVYDFGSEQTGYFVCRASGKAGDAIRIRHAEELDEHGRALPLRCNCNYDESWTLSGRNPDILAYTDYKAFRYVELTVPDGVRVEEPYVLCRHYPLGASAAAFASPSPLLQGVWNICARAVILGAQGVFVDCPSREKGQYLGDMTITAPAHAYIAGDARLWAKALRDIADSAFICPGLMAVAPASFMQEIADYSLLYPLQLLNCVRHTGDRALLHELLPAAEGAAEYFRRYERADGLLENVREKWNLVDWPDNLRDGYDFELKDGATGDGPHAVLNAFYAVCLQALAELRALAGLPGGDLAGRLQRLRRAYREAFYRPSCGLMADSATSSHTALHASALALYAGLFPEGKTDNAVEFIRRKGLCCGVYFSYFVLKGLAKANRLDIVRQLMLGTGEHSWANMLHEGASACFEAWGKTQKWNTSLCHPWAAAPVTVLIEDLLGVRPAEPGYAVTAIDPRLPAEFPDFSLTLHLPTVTLNFAYSDEQLTLRATGQTSGTLVVPDGEDATANLPYQAGDRVEHVFPH